MRRTMSLLGLAVIATFPLTLAASASSSTTAPTCMGRTVTIMGTDGPDNLVGQSGVSDVIYGGLGNDTISGGDFYQGDAIPGTAPDYICGGPGDDHISDSPGSDHINGGDGNDSVNTSGLGNDVLRGNAGDDVVRDKSCEDCGAGNDVLHGDSGNDTIYSGWGKDKDYGDAGADSIYDSECDGPTYLNGGGGNDYLESWSSSFEGWHGNVCSQVADTVDGSTGTDTSQTDRLDKVLNVEHSTRITTPTQ